MDGQGDKDESGWTPELKLQALKEGVTAAIGLVIVIFTLFMAYMVFAYVGDSQKMSDANDVLLLVMGLAGVVIGYYFGRVPADARAAQAQGEANAANSRVQKMGDETQAASDQVDRVMADMAQATTAPRGEAGPLEQAIDRLNKVRDRLRQLNTM